MFSAGRSYTTGKEKSKELCFKILKPENEAEKKVVREHENWIKS